MSLANNTPIKKALIEGSGKLSESSSSPMLDAEILLLKAIGKNDRLYLYANHEVKISSENLETYNEYIDRRAKMEPVAYIVGQKNFYGLIFHTDHRVLVPRPETELLVDEAINESKSDFPLTIVDIGTGSGCIPVSIARNTNSNDVKIFATDISKDALAVAEKNAKLHGVDGQITFLQGNLLEPYISTNTELDTGSRMLITANLPYISNREYENPKDESILREPRLALVGGKIGTEMFLDLFRQIKNYNLKSKFDELTIITEHGHNQAQDIFKGAVNILKTKNVTCKKDTQGFDRVTVIKI